MAEPQTVEEWTKVAAEEVQDQLLRFYNRLQMDDSSTFVSPEAYEGTRPVAAVIMDAIAALTQLYAGSEEALLAGECD